MKLGCNQPCKVGVSNYAKSNCCCMSSRLEKRSMIERFGVDSTLLLRCGGHTSVETCSVTQSSVNSYKRLAQAVGKKQARGLPSPEAVPGFRAARLSPVARFRQF